MPPRYSNAIAFLPTVIHSVAMDRASAIPYNVGAAVYTYCMYSHIFYPYVTDYFLESKPVLRAWSSPWDMGKAGRLVRAVWEQGDQAYRGSSLANRPLITIHNIEIIRNPSLWSQYHLRKTAMKFRMLKRVPLGVPAQGQTNMPTSIDMESAPIIDRTVNECYLFSAYAQAVLNQVISTGQRPDLGHYDAPKLLGLFSGKGHGALGRGAYYTDQIDKAVSYSPCPACNSTDRCNPGCASPHRTVLLSRVLLGQAYTVTDGQYLRHSHHNHLVKQVTLGGATSPQNQSRVGHDSGTNIGEDVMGEARRAPFGPGRGTKYDSVIGLKSYEPGGSAITAGVSGNNFDSNEYLIRNGDQAYPEFLVHYTVQ